MTTVWQQLLLLFFDPGLDAFTLGSESIEVPLSGSFGLCLVESLLSSLQDLPPLLLSASDCVLNLSSPALIQALVVTQTLASSLQILELCIPIRLGAQSSLKRTNIPLGGLYSLKTST